MYKTINIKNILAVVSLLALITACSETSSLEAGEQLYTGLKKIKYENYVSDDHASKTQVEVEASLAAAPNGALFGSSYYRTPFPYGLWIYNAFHDNKGVFAKWLVSSFGKAPVVMSEVNPELRVSVAKTVLQNYGYFRGNVDYSIIEGKPETTKNDSVKRPRTAKIQYTVKMGPEFQLDSIAYQGFSAEAYNLICPQQKSKDWDAETEPLLHRGDAFEVSNLDAERNRISEVFRNHGYYFFEPSYISFQADTMQKDTKVQLKVLLSDSLPDNAVRPYSIGKIDVLLRNQFGEILNDSSGRRFLKMKYNGEKSPVRARVIYNNMKLRHGALFSQDLYQQSYNSLTQTGIFSSVDFQFNPRPDCDTLDMQISCVIDKPYDFTVQANFTGKTNGRLGPGANVSFAKRNAFRGGEVLSFTLGANYEFQSSGSDADNSNTYDFTGNLALAIPRCVAPKFLIGKRRRWQTTPSTTLNIAGEMLNRSGFFRRNLLSADITYTFQPSIQSRHVFSPLILEYDHMVSVTDEYMEKVETSPFLLINLDDHFMPKMRYSYTYTSPTNYRHPIYWNATLTESGNLLSLGFMAAGRKFNEKDKQVMNTPFSQFVKFETEFTKTWRTSEDASLLFHTAFGIMKCLGNSSKAPFGEYFYIGGPSSLRAFSARSLGPGSMYNSNGKMRYATNVGDIKFLMNLEYRPKIFGSLYGALFVDAGNIWTLDESSDEYKALNNTYGSSDAGSPTYSGSNTRIHADKLLDNLALGVGAGIRYDLDFFVIRLDWGVALHAPYDTGRSGYFNIKKFRDAQCINFAIGYPF